MSRRNHAHATAHDGNGKSVPLRKARPRASDDVLRKANERLVLEVLRSNAAEDDLREVAEFRERLIGVIGHDLRNPLNAVLMAAGLLAAGGHLTETEAQLATRIVDSGRRMKRIISALVEFTRARLGGGIDLHVAESDLGMICEQIAAELRMGALATVDVDVRGDVLGMWDEARLGEAISNVAGNAVEHGDKRSPVVIDVYDAGAGFVAAAITNRGKTIPKDAQKQLFEPFKRSKQETREPGHLGLGLFITQEVVLAHGGTLDVRSEAGSTTFTIRLPRTP